MRVILIFIGGPFDGGSRLVSASGLTRGRFVFRERGEHLYSSERPWDGAAGEVRLRDAGRLVRVGERLVSQ